MKFRENEDAVSPVIGVILMVAITVILAAVIAAFVFGMSDSVTPQKEVYVTATQGVAKDNEKTISILTVTIKGGKDIGLLESIEILLNGAPEEMRGKETTESESEDKTRWTKKLEVGNSNSIALKDSGHVIVRATFKDGSQSVLLERDVTVASGGNDGTGEG